MDINVSLESFEGPLDLLLHLIEKNKVDIYDIPISMITAQYLEILSSNQDRDLENMSAFLVMAATLIDIKSRMLLPVEEEEEEEDPRSELVDQLLQYKMYKYMSYVLKDRQFDAEMLYYRDKQLPPEVEQYETPVDLDELTKDMDLDKLHQIFLSVLQREKNKVDPIRASFGEIKKEKVSLEDRVSSLKHYAGKHRSFGFRKLLADCNDKSEVIVTFLAVLELVKSGTLTVSQEHLFDDINLESTIA